MRNNEFNIIDIGKQEVSSNVMFFNYILKNWSINKLSSEHTDYDFILESNVYNRWMLFRISDFGKYQKVVIWLNFLDIPKSANFDMQTYFYYNLKIKNIDQKLKFKFVTKSDFVKQLQSVLHYMINELDINGKLIFEGKFWIDFSFDWHEYK